MPEQSSQKYPLRKKTEKSHPFVPDYGILCMIVVYISQLYMKSGKGMKLHQVNRCRYGSIFVIINSGGRV
jgi:hypothetical protein